MKEMYAEDYKLIELMSVAAARQIGDGEVVFTGTGFPMLGSMLAQHMHAPNCVTVFQAGAVDCKLAHLPMSVGDTRTVRLSSTVTGLFDVFSTVLQRGFIDIGFLGGAQVDVYGNINSTCIGDYRKPKVRLPGSGGAGDIACLSRKTVISVVHEKRRLPERVDYITSPGWIDGPEERKRAGLPLGGPSAIITTRGILKFDEKVKKAYLASYHPGVTPEEVQENTGFKLDVSRAEETEPPTKEEIRILREKIDPEGIFLRAEE